MRIASRILMPVLVLAGLTGCAGVSPIQLGQTAGAIAGTAIVPGIGTSLGALLGTLAGLVVERQVDQVREQQERVDLGNQLSRPSLAQPAAGGVPVGQPTRVWVDERLVNGRLTGGHFETRFIL